MNAATEYWPRLLKPVEDDSLERFVEAMGKVLRDSNYGLPLSVYAQTCTGCMRCSQQCQVFQQSEDLKDTPHYRTEQIIRLYREFFLPSFRGISLKRSSLDEWKEAQADFNLKELIESLYRCTLCRRCTEECPMGIDHRLVARFGRQVLSEMGLVPQNMGGSTVEQIFGIGNTSAFPEAAIIDTLDFLEEDIYDTYGMHCTIPRNRANAEYLILSPVSDYMMEAETLMGIAMVMHSIGCDWTVSTEYCDAINYGLFYDDRVMVTVLDKIVAEAKRLNVKQVIIGECGHATRTAIGYWKSSLNSKGLVVKSILEVTAEAIEKGLIKPDRTKNTSKIVLHDPCNIVRGCGIYKPQREILESCAMGFVEMQPNGRYNYCCGGGGGIVIAEDLHDFRVEVIGKVKADQIVASGAEIVCAPCANCKKMLRELVDHYKIPAEVVGIHDLMAKALAVEKPEGVQPEESSEAA